MTINDFTPEAAVKAGIPEIQINDVKFMGSAQNGSVLIYGEYPDGTHYENTITGEFCDQGETWEDYYECITASDDDGNVLGFAHIKGKDWV